MKGEIIQHSDGYVALMEEINAIQVEVMKESVEAVMKGKWLIGEAIRSEERVYGKEAQLAKDLGVSDRTIRYCVGFYDQYPEKTGDKAFGKLPAIKNLNWTNLLNHHGKGDKEECDHEVERIPRGRCKKCGRVFSEDPTIK